MKFAPYTDAVISRTNSDLDGTKVYIVGIGIENDPSLPGNLYIVKKADMTVFPEGWECILIIDSCLDEI